jgi:hypothetical protein
VYSRRGHSSDDRVNAPAYNAVFAHLLIIGGRKHSHFGSATSSFDHLVSGNKQCGRKRESGRLSSLLVDGELHFRDLLYRQVGRFYNMCVTTSPPHIVIGQVELWGEVIEHEWGYRAEYAAIKSIYSDSDIAHQIREIYGVGEP